jgi:hypothetical protein
MTRPNGTHFGLGYVAAMPAGGGTPVPFGLLKDVSFDVDIKTIVERGQYMDPVAVGYGERTTKGKVGSASLFGGAIAQILGTTAATGSTLVVPSEVAVIPTTPFQITVSHSATWAADLCVLDLTTGLFMTPNSGTLAAGQYSVSSGVYTFYSGDAGHNVSLAYSYTAASAGKTVTVSNAVMSLAPSYQLIAFGPGTSSNVFGVKFYAAYIGKLSWALKPTDFTMQSLEFEAGADPTTTKVMDIITEM